MSRRRHTRRHSSRGERIAAVIVSLIVLGGIAAVTDMPDGVTGVAAVVLVIIGLYHLGRGTGRRTRRYRRY